LVGTESSGKAIGQRNVDKRYFVEIRFLSHVEDVRQVSNRQNPSKVGIKLTLQLFECRFSITSPNRHVVLLFNAYLVSSRYKAKWLLQSGLESASHRLYVR
jgi:hypothetical protein